MPDGPLPASPVEEFLDNRTFDEVGGGESASLSGAVTQRDFDLLTAASGDIDPVHLLCGKAAASPCAPARCARGAARCPAETAAAGRRRAAIATAVVHPVDASSLLAAVAAAGW